MADYISREAALLKLMQDGCPASSIESLESVTAANVVEVVRCGKCKYKRDTLYCRLRKTPVIVSNSDFCSFGKRKGEKGG